MTQKSLKVPKRPRRVSLWVHPDGLVIGDLYLREQSEKLIGPEEPEEVLNTTDQFVVLRLDQPCDLRFYNKASIVRVEYSAQLTREARQATPMRCRLHMMDGALLEGEIRRNLPPERSRLFDYVNLGEERFVKIHLDEGVVHLINKSYVVCISALD